MRLRTLPVSLAGVICACGYAISDGVFHWPQAVICALFAVLCQIASNFANEYFDYKSGRDRPGRAGFRRGVTEGDINPEQMKRAVFGVLILAALLGLSLTYWGGLWLIACGAAIGLGALGYSAGPFPFSTHCLGEVAVIFFFGIVPVNLTYYVQSMSWNHDVLMASIAIGLMGANVLIVNNTRDIPDDEAVGKHTLATVTSPLFMAILYMVNALAAVALTRTGWMHGSDFWLIAPALYVGAAASIAYRLYKERGAALNPLLGMTAMSMFIFSVLLSLAL